MPPCSPGFAFVLALAALAWYSVGPAQAANGVRTNLPSASQASLIVDNPLAFVLTIVILACGLCLEIERRRRERAKTGSSRESPTPASAQLHWPSENATNDAGRNCRPALAAFVPDRGFTLSPANVGAPDASVTSARQPAPTRFDSTICPSARIGNYIAQEPVGRGAFAEVWKAAHHERPQRIVALKIATAPAYRRQLSREGTLPEIDHPNVVPILDSDTRFAEVPYIVMPYYSKGSLADLIAQHPQGLPEEWVESLLADILAGLGAAHQAGIVHRDVKPQNVMIGDDGRALVSDFGLALTDEQAAPLASVMQSASLDASQRGSLVGTLAYMAPEVRDGAQATPAADVYAVGVMLFEMLTGRRPAGLEFPSEIRTDFALGGRWDDVYAKCCQPATRRIKNALEVGAVVAQQVAMPVGQAAQSDAMTRMAAAVKQQAAWSGGPSQEPANGDATALVARAKQYDLGDGVIRDYQRAAQLYQDAAKLGDAAAKWRLGEMFLEGLGVPENRDKAIEWFRSAATTCRMYQHNLGYMYWKGQRIPQDRVFAYLFFNLAAAVGSSNARKFRDELQREMSASEVQRAQLLSRDWTNRNGLASIID